MASSNLRAANLQDRLNPPLTTEILEPVSFESCEVVLIKLARPPRGGLASTSGPGRPRHYGGEREALLNHLQTALTIVVPAAE